MKQGIHPNTNPVIYLDVSTNDETYGFSTLKSEETRDVDGVTHYVIKCDVTSASHPFFTGEKRFVDRQGLVDKFRRRQKVGQSAQEKATQKQTAKQEESAPKEAKSYKQVLQESKKQVSKQAA